MDVPRTPLTRSYALGFTLAALLPLAPAASARAEAPKWGDCPGVVRKLVDKADRITRGDSSKGVMTMKVYKRGTVSMRIRFWSQGRDKFLVKVVRPSRLRGMATLKSGDNLWNYLPRLDRIMRLGSSTMGSSWMGSHFTNDDLVKETDVRKHYDCAAFEDDGKYLTVTMRPKPDAPVVWGKVVAKVRKRDTMPLWFRYYDERGALKRTMRYERVRKMGGRRIPTRMVLQPEDAPSERTVVTYNRVRFNVPLGDRTFTLQGLKR